MNNLLKSLIGAATGGSALPFAAIEAAATLVTAVKKVKGAETADDVVSALRGLTGEDAKAVMKEITPETIAALQASDADQAEIGKIHARSKDPFTVRARPAIIWVCVIGLAVVFIIKPMVEILLYAYAYFAGEHMLPLPEFPEMSTTELLGLLFPILGLGGYRTFEKVTKSNNH